MKLLIIFPNAANWAAISTAVPILAGIAVERGWQTAYFDTWNYAKGRDSSSDKEKAGGFKPGFSVITEPSHPFSDILPDLQEKIDEFSPDLIAITALSHEYEFLLTILPSLRIPQRTRVIIGGIHATLEREKVAASGFFDLVAFAEAESVFPEILERLEKERDLEKIEGTYFRDRNKGTLKKSPKRKLLPPDALWKTRPDFTFFGEMYFTRPFDGRLIRRYDAETARGCPYDCAYCGNSALREFSKGLGRYVKTRPLDSAIGQMRKMRDDYTIDLFQFTDECFLSHSESWLKDFMSLYKAEINRPYILQTRSETVSEAKIDLLLGYGIPFQVSIGVESGADHILNDTCGRMCTQNQIRRAFGILNARRIRTNAFFMIGFPFETRDDFFLTVELCREIKPSVASISIFQPLPGQRITEECLRNGFITGDESMATFTSHSLLKMPPPYLSPEEIHSLWRTFMLYAALPKEYYPDIEKCEKDPRRTKQLFDSLIELRWKKYDYANMKGDIKLF